MLKGIDFAYGSGLTTSQIKAAGYQFVCRYLSGGNSKDISAAELLNYVNAGLPVVFVWETSGVDMTSTQNGVWDAQRAQAELASLAAHLGDPSLLEAPIFFAADAQFESDELGYLEGTASVIGHNRNGLYGGLGNMRTAFNAGVIAYGWQTYAWSGGQWDDRALLRQVLNGISVGPAGADLDYAGYWSSSVVMTLADDFGQWPKPNMPAPPAPTPPPPPAPSNTLQLGSKGAAVTQLQTDLNKLDNAGLVVDGDFGLLTEAAVKAFQNKNGLVVDGVVGPLTQAKITALLNPPAPTPPPTPKPISEPVLQEGNTGSAVKLLQTLLNGRPIHPNLTVDGVFGPNTKAAVELVQHNNGLVVDGIVGPNTWGVLGNYV